MDKYKYFYHSHFLYNDIDFHYLNIFAGFIEIESRFYPIAKISGKGKKLGVYCYLWESCDPDDKWKKLEMEIYILWIDLFLTFHLGL